MDRPENTVKRAGSFWALVVTNAPNEIQTKLVDLNEKRRLEKTAY
jgi:hypothetical protein